MHTKNENLKKDIFAFVLFVLFNLLFFEISIDNDTWFILNHGKYVLENGFPATNPFTVTKDLWFIMPQWLTGVIFYFIYSVFGSYGIIIFAFTIYILQSILIYKTCLLINKNRTISFLTTLILSFCISAFLTTRPQILSSTIFLLEIYFLEKYCLTYKNKYLYVLPILSLFLINLHASLFPIFIAFVMPFLFGKINLNSKIITKETYKIKPILLFLLLSILVALINPYGINSVTYGFKSYRIGNISSFIQEMQPTSIEDYNGFIFFAFIFILIFLYLFTDSKYKKIKTRYLFFFAGTVLLALYSIRNLYLFYISIPLVISYFLQDVKFEIKKQYFNNIKNCIPVFFIIFILLFGNFAKLCNANIYFYTPIKEVVDELTITEDIENKNVYAALNDSFYPQWIGAKTPYDLRVETMYKKINQKEDLMNECFDFSDHLIKPENLQKKYNFDYFIIAENDPFEEYLKKNTLKFKVICYDKNYKVYKSIIN